MSTITQIEYTTPKGTIIIRHAMQEDAEELIRHVKKVEKETAFLMREPDEFTMTIEQEKQYLQDKLDSEVSLQMVAENNGKIIGSCSLNGSTRRRTRHCAELGIAIEQEYCGAGIGRKMMETGIECAKRNGISRVTLEVDTNNYKAICLYMKLGFEIEGTFRNDKRLANGTYVSGYAMALLL